MRRHASNDWDFFYWLLGGWRKPKPKPVETPIFNWSVGRPESKKGGDFEMIDISCTIEEKVKVTATPVTVGGKPLTLDGPIEITVQSGDGTAILVDNNSFYVVSGDAIADTIFGVKGIVGGNEIDDTVTLHALAAKAVGLGLAAGTPELK